MHSHFVGGYPCSPCPVGELEGELAQRGVILGFPLCSS